MGSSSSDGLARHSHERLDSLLIVSDESTVARSSSVEVGNWKTTKSVRWSHEHVMAPAPSRMVTQPAEDHEPTPLAFHQRHSITEEHCAYSLALLGAPMHTRPSSTPLPLSCPPTPARRRRRCAAGV